MRFLFLNQYFPPDPAPTGVLMRELGAFLQSRGHEVEYVSAQQVYRTDKKHQRRIVRELKAWFSVFRRALSARRPDVIFSGSSPPCLLIAAALAAKRHGAKSAHWAMDLYPEVAVALGEISSGVVARMIQRGMISAYKSCGLVVSLDRDMQAHLRKFGVESRIVSPWVLEDTHPTTLGVRPDEMFTWLYSGNLGRAHEWKTLLNAQAIIEKRDLPIHLVFQGGGPSRRPAEEYAKELGLKNCIWRDYVEPEKLHESLLRAEVLVVTQRDEVQGLLWPSKLALVTKLPRPVLWVGPEGGAIAQDITAENRGPVFSINDTEDIADWLQKRFGEQSERAYPKADDPLIEREQSIAKLAGFLKAL